ncbi:MAG TPA: hypothetical protein VIG29_21845, partial [Vicinamibacteria bacterium]
HFDSLQFIQSSGSFDPSGNDFVFGGISKGKAVLSFVAIPSGHITREVDYPEIGEILNPRWSPDGRNVVFSAVVGGFTDLYLFDVQSGNTRRLTDDPFADIQPDWSPDGRIVFVTDRFSSLPSELRFGRYELGILDVGSGEISSLELFASGDHWDPHWSENGLFFLSDRTGRPNIYRWTSSSGVREVTSLSAGVLGITKLSPALTVSAAGDRILFSVREEDENRIYAIDDPQILAGRAIDDSADEELGETRAPAASVLPPLRRTSVVASWLESPSRPPEAPAVSEMPRMEAEVEDYRVDFDLDFVGQPYVVAGSNRFGSFLGGGVSFLWSDMLGDHQIGLQVQTTGDIENVAAIAGYENRASRWYWGGSISHIPFVQGSFQSGISTIDGELVEFEELLELRQTESRVGGYVAYPFHRAQRIEFSSGFTRYGFSQTAETFAVSLETGRIVIDESIDLPAPDTLYLGDANAALVYDTALLGPTSPLAGTRYRFEAGTSYGSLDFQTALADFRHYAMPFRPFTI